MNGIPDFPGPEQFGFIRSNRIYLYFRRHIEVVIIHAFILQTSPKSYRQEAKSPETTAPFSSFIFSEWVALYSSSAATIRKR